MQRYSVFAIARQALSWHQGWERAWQSPEPRPRYDAIIVGAGGHGLASAYYLGRNHGITNVAEEMGEVCVHNGFSTNSSTRPNRKFGSLGMITPRQV